MSRVAPTLIVCAVLLAGCSGPTQPKATTTGDPTRDKVLIALYKCVDDADGLEVISWGELNSDKGDPKSMTFRFRAKNKIGGKQVYDWTAFFKDGHVVEFMDPYAPPAGERRQVPR